MNLVKNSFFVAPFLVVNLAIAVPVCGFNVEDNNSFHFKNDGACSLSIVGNINYLAMNYLEIDETQGIDKLLSDKNYFYDENGLGYFASEEVDEPKATIHLKRDQAAKKISFNGLRGYTATVDYFFQKLPNFGDKSAGYSLNVSCIFLAAGNDTKSIKTRFCVPNTNLGHKKLLLYKDAIMRISP